MKEFEIRIVASSSMVYVILESKALAKLANIASQILLLGLKSTMTLFSLANHNECLT